jgi:hypothetical protein
MRPPMAARTGSVEFSLPHSIASAAALDRRATPDSRSYGRIRAISPDRAPRVPQQWPEGVDVAADRPSRQ